MFDGKPTTMKDKSRGADQPTGTALEDGSASATIVQALQRDQIDAAKSKMRPTLAPGELAKSLTGDKTNPSMSSSGKPIDQSSTAKSIDKSKVVGKDEPPSGDAQLYKGRKSPANAPPHQLETLKQSITILTDGTQTQRTTSTNKTTGETKHILDERPDGSSSSFFYENGKPTHAVHCDSKGEEIESRTYSYDATGKQTVKVYPPPGDDKSLDIAQTTELANTTRDTILNKRSGEIDMIRDWNKDGSISTYAYDNQGRIKREEHFDSEEEMSAGRQRESTNYAYDVNGNKIIVSTGFRLPNGAFRDVRFDRKTGDVKNISDTSKDGSYTDYDYKKSKVLSAKSYDFDGYPTKDTIYRYSAEGNRTAEPQPVKKPKLEERLYKRAKELVGYGDPI